MKILIPFHVGSGNRGCEGIIRGTANILQMRNCDIFLLSRNQEEYELDTNLGLKDVGTLFVKTNRSLPAKAIHKLGTDTKAYYLNPYKKFLDSAENDTICLFTGGDLFCYANTIKENCYVHDYLKQKNVKTVLWGASIEDRFLDRSVEQQLKAFDQIVCRETRTLKLLMKHGITENVMCAPDSAFTLEPVITELPTCFVKSKIIGINISNMVNNGGFSMDTLFMRSIQKLIQFIMKETDYHILLIPHVTWSRQDDRKICNELYKLMLSKDRISVLNVDDLSYLKIRYIISQCSLFVGGRTHSVISAYSTGVPTIALGYSIKAVGIAKDLGLDTRLVFETNNIKNEEDLLQQFKYLLEKQNEIKAQLNSVLPDYKKKAFTARDAISTYLN